MGSRVIDHVVEAKGFRSDSIGGYFAILNGKGSPNWSRNALARAEIAGVAGARALLNRDAAGNVRFHTSFMDSVRLW